MCYSIEQYKDLNQLEFRFKVKANIRSGVAPEKLTYYHANGFAHPHVAIIPQENPKFLTSIMWGLVPYWESSTRYKEYYKETLGYGSGLNAKSMKLFSSDMYMSSAENRRCIVPLTGFHEPHHTDVKIKGETFKVPFRFARRDEELMNVAGIYDFTKDGMPTFSILTKEATPLFAKIHNKKNSRPVILHDKDVDTWLDKSSTREELEKLIANDMPDDLLKAYPINRDLYKIKIDTNMSGITEQVDYEEITIEY